MQVGVYTVNDAVADDLADRERHGMATFDRARQDFEAHVLPHLGREAVERLTRKKIEEWMKLVSDLLACF